MVGLDNYSKYGRLEKSYDTHPQYHFVEGNAKDKELLNELLEDRDHFVASAAMIGGISYFHELPTTFSRKTRGSPLPHLTRRFAPTSTADSNKLPWSRPPWCLKTPRNF